MSSKIVQQQKTGHDSLSLTIFFINLSIPSTMGTKCAQHAYPIQPIATLMLPLSSLQYAALLIIIPASAVKSSCDDLINKGTFEVQKTVNYKF